jgi:hypothetical protein
MLIPSLQMLSYLGPRYRAIQLMPILANQTATEFSDDPTSPPSFSAGWSWPTLGGWLPL